jgi:plasmid stabilization system protein ParE
MAEEFAKGVPDNSLPLANIAVYIKEAKTPKEAVKYVHKLTTKIENAIKQKREESRVNTVGTALMRA